MGLPLGMHVLNAKKLGVKERRQVFDRGVWPHSLVSPPVVTKAAPRRRTKLPAAKTVSSRKRLSPDRQSTGCIPPPNSPSSIDSLAQPASISACAEWPETEGISGSSGYSAPSSSGTSSSLSPVPWGSYTPSVWPTLDDSLDPRRPIDFGLPSSPTSYDSGCYYPSSSGIQSQPATTLGLGLDLGDTSIYDLFTNTTYPYSLPLPNQQGTYPYTSAATPSGYTASTFTFPPSEFIPKQDGYNLDLYY